MESVTWCLLFSTGCLTLTGLSKSASPKLQQSASFYKVSFCFIMTQKKNQFRETSQRLHKMKQAARGQHSVQASAPAEYTEAVHRQPRHVRGFIQSILCLWQRKKDEMLIKYLNPPGMPPACAHCQPQRKCTNTCIHLNAKYWMCTGRASSEWTQAAQHALSDDLQRFFRAGGCRSVCLTLFLSQTSWCALVMVVAVVKVCFDRMSLDKEACWPLGIFFFLHQRVIITKKHHGEYLLG